MRTYATDLKVVEKIKEAVNMDGWANILTHLGFKGKDKRLEAHVEWQRPEPMAMEALYAGDDIARNLADLVPDEAMSKGYKISGLKTEDDQTLVWNRIRELKVNEKVNEAWTQDRIRGGCGIFMVLEDGKMDAPIAPRKLKALNIINSRDLRVDGTSDIDDDVMSPNYKEPKTYSLSMNIGAKSYTAKMDASRVVRFPGIYLPEDLYKHNGYWGDSVLNMMKNAIRNYSTSHDSAAATILDFSIPVLKMQGLSALIMSNGDQKVLKRVEIINLAKSIGRMVLLDADKESFEHATRNVAGMAEMIGKVEQRLLTAAKVPATKLFGGSPGAMTGGGEHEMSNWYDFLESQQQNYLKPKLLQIIRHIVETEFASAIDKTVNEIDLDFNELWQASEKENAEVRKLQAEVDAVYITNQVIDPAEVAQSRFGGEKYSTDTELDWDLREKMNATGGDPAEENQEGEEVPGDATTKKPGKGVPPGDPEVQPRTVPRDPA